MRTLQFLCTFVGARGFQVVGWADEVLTQMSWKNVDLVRKDAIDVCVSLSLSLSLSLCFSLLFVRMIMCRTMSSSYIGGHADAHTHPRKHTETLSLAQPHTHAHTNTGTITYRVHEHKLGRAFTHLYTHICAHIHAHHCARTHASMQARKHASTQARKHASKHGTQGLTTQTCQSMARTDENFELTNSCCAHAPPFPCVLVLDFVLVLLFSVQVLVSRTVFP